jgi:2-keto-4-pentenoate hydratase/2-oxohepta-3-ene-1,7-dioic acid hydratase in catechol pathway
MRVCRVLNGEDARYGLADDCTVTLMSDEPFAAWEREEDVPLRTARLLAPVVPTKIVAAGINYRTHAKEMGHKLPKDPVIFMKPSTAVNAPGGSIQVPQPGVRVDYEGELAVVIGRRCRHVRPDEAHHHILGYTCANDVTARDLQQVDGQWTRAKGFDGFCPLGPWVETDTDPLDLKLETLLNGEVVQSARTSDMIFDVYELVSFISSVMTLLPGDIVLTGTPGGIGPMHPGDVVEVRIEGIGTLTNPVVPAL